MAVHGISECLDDDFLSYVEEIFANEPEENGSVYDGKMSDVRRSRVKHKRDQAIENHLWTFISDVNAEHYGYDLWKHCHLQYTMYHGSDNGHYDWHVDVDYNPQKKYTTKLSLTIQLSDENDYEGGEFQALDIDISPNLKKRGSLIMFPSWLNHRVTPVTSGTRKSLVAWFHGPMWR